MQCNLKETVGLEYQYPLFILAIHRLWDGDAALSTAVSPKSAFAGPGQVENSANALLALEPQISPTKLAVKVSEQVPRALWLEGLLQDVCGPWVTICCLKLHSWLYDRISWYFMYIQSLHKRIPYYSYHSYPHEASLYPTQMQWTCLNPNDFEAPNFGSTSPPWIGWMDFA